jgi:molybdopterin converting factor subunit 1
MVTIKFFAMLKNKVGKETAGLSIGQAVTLEEFKESMRKEFPEIADYLIGKRLLISVNQEFADKDTIIKDGDEVGLLPPFSGG